MVSIDTVYQKVLAFANKEQRGYITPQEFNLFADQAQMEIFEQYFYDLNQHQRIHGSSEEYSDMSHNLNEKIAFFESVAAVTQGGSITATDLYRLGTVVNAIGVEVEEVQQNELLYLTKSPLTIPTANRPVYVRIGPLSLNMTPAAPGNCTYVRKPLKPSWGYVVVNGKALYNPSTVVNFELHPAEESELVYKILKFAGISMKKDDIARAGQVQEQLQVQQEKQ